jgi:hypothetical protein
LSNRVLWVKSNTLIKIEGLEWVWHKVVLGDVIGTKLELGRTDDSGGRKARLI